MSTPSARKPDDEQRPRLAKPAKEPWPEQAASFIGFFIYLLILKSFFLPLFIIPTGSMAETLYGEHARHTCPNCGVEYGIGWQQPPTWPREVRYHPPAVLCPNCHWMEYHNFGNRGFPLPRDLQPDEVLTGRLVPAAGDRIFVHGWPYAPSLSGIAGLGPQRWDVVVFKVPTDGDTNYIKRLLGLPGEKIELIDGDVFANDEIARKSGEAQRSLWFRCFDQDHAPRKPAIRQKYYPRWIAVPSDSGWSGLETRVPVFEGAERGRGEIQFVTDLGETQAPGRIHDTYGYNGPLPVEPNIARDLRLSADVTLEAGDGYFELSLTKFEDRFRARLYADGRVTLEHEAQGSGRDGGSELWGEARVDVSGPVRLALSNVDYEVSVLIDGRPVIASTPDQYAITPAEARRRAARREVPVVRCAAERARVRLRHLLIERDVYYTSEASRANGQPANAGTGHPLQLGAEEYFCCGDNSPNSLDGRYWYADMLGPHLWPAYEAGAYTPGTVPADQMLGRAFLVYWPGFMPLTSEGPNILPDLGRVRWIH